MNDLHYTWATQHDWFRGYNRSRRSNQFSIEVYDSELDKNVWFEDIQELRIWAGY